LSNRTVQVTADAILDELGITADMLLSRGLQRWPDATRLEVAETGEDGREHRLQPQAARAWRRMKSAAMLDGERLHIVSGFRSADRQAQIIRRKLQSGLSIEQILTVSAPPGYSEHHTGRAVDLSTPGAPPLELEFETTSAFRWLCGNAARFGFSLSYPAGNPHGYGYEPWHWCYREADETSRGRAEELDRQTKT
jgi:D-alanyl-D-alanine carboxypeptidase